MITLNLNNIRAEAIGKTHGFDWSKEWQAHQGLLSDYVNKIISHQDFDDEFLGWIDLPENNNHVQDILAYVADVPRHISDVVVLGIGGSSLGAMSVIRALQHPYHHFIEHPQHYHQGLRVHFVDNVDPDVIMGLLEQLNSVHTLVNVISKSGTTAETMASYLIFRDWLSATLGESYKTRIIVTTDPETGILRPLAEREGYTTFSVPPSVGGRFSVMSAVGLLPIALAGIDIQALVEGAAAANRLVHEADSPIQKTALIQYLAYRAGKHISVFMPYSSRLRYLSDWYVQLWAESLGKAENRLGSKVYEGSTPLAALGATDQHSQVQLFNEGPNNKIFNFIRIAEFANKVVIPEAIAGLEKLDYLADKSLATLLNAEQAATAFALAERERPNYTLTLEKLDAYHLGMLLQWLEWQTALMGELLNINAFNQPGVELAKRYTYALMGREGFEAELAQLNDGGISMADIKDNTPIFRPIWYNAGVYHKYSDLKFKSH